MVTNEVYNKPPYEGQIYSGVGLSLLNGRLSQMPTALLSPQCVQRSQDGAQNQYCDTAHVTWHRGTRSA